MNDTPQSKATDRLLIVFETIARQGPILLTDLTAATDLPRSAVHRAAQVLQRRGWIRARLSDHAYELSGAFDAMMSNAAFASEEGEALAPLMAELAGKTMHADLGVFRSLGVFQLVESTDKTAHLGPRSLVSSQLALIAQAALGAEARVRHLDAFMAGADEGERQIITSGRHFKSLRGLGQSPYKISLTQGAALAGFVSPGGAAGALRLRLRSGKNASFPATIGQRLRRALDQAGFMLPSLQGADAKGQAPTARQTGTRH